MRFAAMFDPAGFPIAVDGEGQERKQEDSADQNAFENDQFSRIDLARGQKTDEEAEDGSADA